MRIGSQPHPRLLVIGYEQDVVSRLAEVVPTVRSAAAITEVEQIEFDLLVHKGSAPEMERHLNALIFAHFPAACQFGGISTAGGRAVVSYVEESYATEFVSSADLPQPLGHLLHNVLAPAANVQQVHGVLAARVISRSAPTTVPTAIQTWLSDTRGRILAGSFTRVGDASECWCIPSYVTDPIPWVQAAIHIWGERDPERFPQRTEWQERAAWQTAEERRTNGELETLLAERDRLLSEANGRIEDKARQIAAVRKRADERERMLLTAQGDELVTTVSTALEEMGFVVRNMDEVWPLNDRLEDLRLSDPEADSSWIAIAEVRGYAAGAQSRDLLRIAGRFRPRYIQETGVEPASSWYIVNQFLDTDPEERPAPLVSDPGSVQTFAEDSAGIVIDTRTLFRVWIDVQLELVTRERAREILRTSTGVLAYP